MTRAFGVLVATLLIGPPCASSRPERERPPRQVPAVALGGDVVATVGSTAITRDEVAARASSRGLSTLEALRELETEVLLADEARRRDLAPRSDEERSRQALAQLVLRDLEREHDESGIAAADVQSRIAALRTVMAHPERRLSTHLLIRVPESATSAVRARARAVASEALRAVVGRSPDSVDLERVAGTLRDAHPDEDIVVETLPMSDRTAPFVPSFLEALFSTPAEGVVPRVVETSFGEHVIFVTRVEAAVTPTPESVRERARDEVLIANRRAAVIELLRSLRSTIPTRLEAETVARRLGDDHLFEATR